MNATDSKMLISDYEKARDEAERSFELSVIKIQDAAYAMGYERGCGHQSKMAKALEDAACQLLDLGYQAQSQEIDKLIYEVTE